MLLAKEVSPSISLTAINIRSKTLPKTLLRNIKFFWTDSYFLVAQCVLYTALTESQWDVALSEIYRVLALSVWVQIIEGSTISTHMGLYSERIGNILGKMYSHKDLLIDVAKSLPDMLA